MSEEQEHSQIATYLRMQYPNIMFNVDMSGVKLTPGLANKIALLRSHDKYPDIVIYKPMLINNQLYYGLFIELKKTGENLFNKTCQYKTEHLRKQAEALSKLNNLGYKAVFAIGFDEAKHVIDNYLNGVRF